MKMKQTTPKLKLKSVPTFLKWSIPTPPLIQYFDLSKTPESKLFSDSLNEALRFGTHILGWFRDEFRDEKYCEAVSGLFSEQLQRTDAVAAMFQTGAYSTCPIMIRSMVEIFLQMKYLMESDSDHRAMALQFMGKIKRMEFVSELLETSDDGKRIRELLKKDRSGGEFELDGDSDELKELGKEIASSDYAEINAEYIRKTDGKNKRIEWYSFFDGPNELRKLAEIVGETGIYYMCYRKFNEYVHGTQRFREEQYWKKQGTWKNSLDVRPLDPAPLFHETFLVVFRTLEFLLSKVHIEPAYWRDWAISCKLLGLPGFQNMVLNSPDGQALDVELQ